MIDGYDSPRGTRLAAEENRRRDDRKRDPGLQQQGDATETSVNPDVAKTPGQHEQTSGTLHQQGGEGAAGKTSQPIYKDWASI